MENIKKLLPSRKFTIIFGIFLLVILIIALISFFFNRNDKFVSEKEGLTSVSDQTIQELVNTDTDLDSIPDWEEALWGTQKDNRATFDGVPDAVYIANKKKELNIEQEQDDKKLTETEAFAREFFSTYVSLKSSGQLSDVDINQFYNALGQKLANSVLPNKYKESQAKILETDTIEDKINYYSNVKDLFAIYSKKGLGDELNIVNNALVSYNNTGKVENYSALSTIGEAYQAFATNVMKTPVPRSLLTYHLSIANASYNTGISVIGMASVTSDPIIGVSGISQYQKYSEELIQAVEDLEESLE